MHAPSAASPGPERKDNTCGIQNVVSSGYSCDFSPTTTYMLSFFPPLPPCEFSLAAETHSDLEGFSPLFCSFLLLVSRSALTHLFLIEKKKISLLSHNAQTAKQVFCRLSRPIHLGDETEQTKFKCFRVSEKVGLKGKSDRTSQPSPELEILVC